MKKILLEAPILTQSGYGEHSRLVFRSLYGQEDVDLYVSPLNWGHTSWTSSYDEERDHIDQCVRKFQSYVSQSQNQGQQVSFDLHLHVGIINEFEQKAPKCISITAGIETDRVSANWLIATNKGINKIIVPSEHAKHVFESTSYQAIDQRANIQTVIQCASPVKVVPYPVKTLKIKNIDLKLNTDFNFLSVALLGPRKNMTSMIKWFVEEFEKDSVGLILKTSASGSSNLDKSTTLDHLEKILSKTSYHEEETKCKIYLLHGDLSEEEMHSLYVREDVHAYLTTTHGEGFGLPIFEAAYSGLPIVATDWSGHVDFLSAPYKESGNLKNKKLFLNLEYELKELKREAVWQGILEEGSKWAYVKKKSFKEKVRLMYEKIDTYREWAQALKKNILVTHSSEKVLEKMRSEILNTLDDASHLTPDDTEVFVL